MMDGLTRLESLLDELAKQTGVLGVALISRDGLAVRASGKVTLSRETFAAMTATFTGASEIALAELDGGKLQSIVATTDRMKLVVVGATRDMLLVASLAADAEHGPIVTKLEAATHRIALDISGG